MRFLALSGSLRARSINTEVLRAAVLVAPHGTITHFSGALSLLPHFNPDLDADSMTPPTPVAVLRAEIAAADALLISCPEYAHGIAGSFKNLLDWLVSGPEMVGKPVCILNASDASLFGPRALVETLSTMSARVVSGGAITVPVNGRRLDAEEIAADAALATALRAALGHVAAAVRLSRTDT
jgi:chromate reductase, NAD(P)H dehydrogenase (quinone)